MTVGVGGPAGTRPRPALPDGPLRRLVQAGPPTGPGEDVARCDLCGIPVRTDHRHLLDEARDELVCVCQACALLFDRRAAARGHYRLVPRRRLRVAGFAVHRGDPGADSCDPADLGIPVGLAFVVLGEDGEPRARCPSPLGVTRWELTPAAWRRLVASAPELTGMEPRVEALLTNTAHGRREHWIVPIDDCYRLVAIVRGEWKGLSGGGRVWPAVDAFFAGLASRSDRRQPGERSRPS